MLLFLYGSDTFRSLAKLQELVSRYGTVHKQRVNLRFFDCAADSFQDIQQELESHSLFQEKKLLVFKHAFANAKTLDFFASRRDFLKKSSDVLVFWEGEKIAKTNALARFLLKHAKAQEFSPLSLASLNTWIQREFKKKGVKADPKVSQFLALALGSDLWRVNNEVQKLAAFAHSKNSSLSLSDVRALGIGQDVHSDVFATIDALAELNKQRALELLSRHLSKGDSPLYLLSMIAYQFRNLLELKAGCNPPLHPYVLSKSRMLASKFSFEKLKSVYRQIAKTDLAIKTGELDPRFALPYFVAKL